MKEKIIKLVKILRRAIKERRLVRFYYESRKSGKKEWRTIEPYIVAIKHNDSIFLAGLPLEELSNSIQKRITGHYLLKKISIDKLEVLPEQYSEPKVERKRITNTPFIKVICRFIYSDEDEQEVTSHWVDIREHLQ